MCSSCNSKLYKTVKQRNQTLFICNHRYVEIHAEFGSCTKISLQLCKTRVTAGVEELGLTYEIFKKGLARSNVMLNNKVLTDLAIWEPRTFKVRI